MNSLDSLLHPFQRFGVHLGLERIERLLAKLGNPHHRVPIVHVAGTNGKGSVCAYLSAVLTAAGYKVGRYISPHLIDWTERICIDEKPIAVDTLKAIILEIQAAIASEEESPTQFEVITAAAWLYFARSKVDIAVIEVGLGGRLDATNVCDRPLVSVITSISKEHWQVLGSTLAEIATEKAGILKPACPVVIGNLPDEAKTVIAKRIEQLDCPAIWVESAREGRWQMADGRWVEEEIRKESHNSQIRYARYQDIEYPLPLLGDIQLMNSAIAIATIQLLQQQGWQIPLEAIQTGMSQTRWLGRLQWTTWKDVPILIDGAHNPAAAKALRQYVDTLDKPVTWVLGILATKEHSEIFKALLRPNEHLYLVPVPDHNTANPTELAALAADLCPDLASIQTFETLFPALDDAIGNHRDRAIVLGGSLYLVGYFIKQCIKS